MQINQDTPAISPKAGKTSKKILQTLMKTVKREL
jgi:hypothetical protein